MRRKQKLLLKGTPASPGIITGKVKIVLDPKKKLEIKKGGLLVASFTTPAYTPFLLCASGVITDIGGMLSHAAIVSRELGIPCVVGTKEATKKLKDGMEVTIDGKKGAIYS